MWQTITAIAVAVLVPVAIQVLKRYKPVLDANPWILRAVVIVVAFAGAVVVQVQTTGVVDWEMALKVAASTYGGAEVSYQWVTKHLSGLAGTPTSE